MLRQSAFALLRKLYHLAVPYPLRRDLWYRRYTGRGYTYTLPPPISIPAEPLTTPIHEVNGPDIVVVLPHSWGGLPRAVRERFRQCAGEHRRVFIVSAQAEQSLEGEASGINLLVIPALTPEVVLASLARLRERYSLVECLCFLPEIAGGVADGIDQNDWSWQVRPVTSEMATVLAQQLDPNQYPLVKLIMLTYNNMLYTHLGLQSILEKTHYPHYEIVVVDNGSKPEMQAYLAKLAEQHPRITLVQNEQNLGFAAGMNVGLRAATNADIIVLLNDDIIVTPGWLTKLIKHLDDHTVGLVGPTTSFTSMTARIPIKYSSLQDIDRFALDVTDANAGQSFDVAMFPFFCTALRMATVSQIGSLDERFRYGMFEDEDYAVRLHQAGYRIVCARDAFVHHFGGTSFNRMDEERKRTIFETNQHLFEEKWQRAWQPQHYGNI